MQPELGAPERWNQIPSTSRSPSTQAADDLKDLAGDVLDSFRFFFAHEVTDGYGRLLAYIHPNQPDTASANRRPSYNRRQLDAGLASPYFIWPNLDPFRAQRSLVDAVLPPGQVAPPAATAAPVGELDRARAAVRAARHQHLGIYRPADPLKLLPFELRFLSRRQPPNRSVIDLGAGDDRLLAQLHYTIANPEDRLYFPEEYVPLFERSGWTPTLSV